MVGRACPIRRLYISSSLPLLYNKIIHTHILNKKCISHIQTQLWPSRMRASFKSDIGVIYRLNVRSGWSRHPEAWAKSAMCVCPLFFLKKIKYIIKTLYILFDSIYRYTYSYTKGIAKWYPQTWKNLSFYCV